MEDEDKSFPCDEEILRDMDVVGVFAFGFNNVEVDADGVRSRRMDVLLEIKFEDALNEDCIFLDILCTESIY